MRWLLFLLIPVALIACSDDTPSASASRQVGPCVAAFKSFDRALSINLGSLFRDLSPGGPSVSDEKSLKEAEARIIENDCLVNSAEIPRIITPRPNMHQNRAGDSGQLNAAQYMHVAITTDRNGARNLEQFYAGLGYTVRVVLVGRLGWRVFIGPLKSNGAVLHAQKLMDQTGLDSAYVVNPGR